MANAKGTRAGGPAKKKAAKRGRRDWKPRFLSALSKCANVSDACKAAKIGRTQAYRARQRDEDFALAWHEALEEACDELEQEARRRALKGSDYLLALLLKAHRPDRFADRARLEHSGPDGSPIRHERTIDVSKLSPETLDELERASASES